MFGGSPNLHCQGGGGAFYVVCLRFTAALSLANRKHWRKLRLTP